MEGFNFAQIVVSVIAALLIGTPLIVLSYLAGRRSQSHGRSYRFDQLQPEASLGGSTWTARFAGDSNPNAEQTIQYQFEQIGCRILARGHSVDGSRHTLEGVLHGKRLCTLAIDESRNGAWLGTVTAELAGPEQMNGMRAHWSPESLTLTVRQATFMRVDPAVSLSEPATIR